MIRLSFLPKLVILIYTRKSYREFFLIPVLLTAIIAVIRADNQCILIGMQSRLLLTCYSSQQGRGIARVCQACKSGALPPYTDSA